MVSKAVLNLQVGKECIGAACPEDVIRTMALPDDAIRTMALPDDAIRMMALKLQRSLPEPGIIDLSDLLFAGRLGLLLARQSWHEQTGVSRGAFFRFRMRGEMLNAVTQTAGVQTAMEIA